MTVITTVILWVAAAALLPIAVKIHGSAWREFAEGRYWSHNMKPCLVPVLAVTWGVFLAVYLSFMNGWSHGVPEALLSVSAILILGSVGYVSSRNMFDAVIDEDVQNHWLAAKRHGAGGGNRRRRNKRH